MLDKFSIHTTAKTRLADTTTPVSIYLRLRDVFPNTILLESSDYHSRENSVSYVCADPVAGITLEDGVLTTYFPDGSKEVKTDFKLIEEIDAFKARFIPIREHKQPLYFFRFIWVLYLECRSVF